jgi:hypothetical protein
METHTDGSAGADPSQPAVAIEEVAHVRVDQEVGSVSVTP